MNDVKLTKSQRRIVAGSPLAAKLIGRCEAINECWVWQGSKSKDGYGHTATPSGTKKTHRLSYEIFCGPIPEGLFVCHHCDNPSCANPSHLFVGTGRDNMRDMTRKNRGRNFITSDQSHFKDGRAPHSERASGARLSLDQAKDIITRAAAGALTKDLAAEFDVHRATIQYLLRGETWPELTRPAGLPRPSGRYSRSAGRSALTMETTET